MFVVEPHDETTALGAVPGELARAAVTRELRAERRADAYAAWTIRMQKAAASKLVCERDRLPELGVVSLSSVRAVPLASRGAKLRAGFTRRRA